jgi:Outer membrane protein beta-barrel domain
MRLRRFICANLIMVAIIIADPRRSAAQSRTPRVGITAGISSSTIAGDADDIISRKTGLTAGVVAVFPVGASVAIQPEILYAMKGAKSASSGIVGTLRLNYFEIPLLVRFDAAPSGRAKPFLYAGPTLAMRAGCDFEVKEAGATQKFNCDEFETEGSGFKTLDYSVLIGGGLAFDVSGKVFSVSVRYDHSLSKFVDDGDLKHRVISVLGTLEFPWAK